MGRHQGLFGLARTYNARSTRQPWRMCWYYLDNGCILRRQSSSCTCRKGNQYTRKNRWIHPLSLIQRLQEQHRNKSCNQVRTHSHPLTTYFRCVWWRPVDRKCNLPRHGHLSTYPSRTECTPLILPVADAYLRWCKTQSGTQRRKHAYLRYDKALQFTRNTRWAWLTRRSKPI